MAVGSITGQTFISMTTPLSGLTTAMELARGVQDAFMLTGFFSTEEETKRSETMTPDERYSCIEKWVARLERTSTARALAVYGDSMRAVNGSHGAYYSATVNAARASLSALRAISVHIIQLLGSSCGIDLKALEEGKTNASKKPKAKAKGKKKPTKGHYIRGICRRCLCAEKGACAGGCSWTDETETLCTACVDGDGNQLPPVEKKPAPKKPSAPKTKARKPTQQTLPAVKAPAKGKKKPTKGRR